MYRFLQEVQISLTIRYAIHSSNIGHMRRLVDQLIILFTSSDQTNYSEEMLFYR